MNSVARTRCGRISRPPRHVIRDYKRLKRLNESTNDVEDENENNGGYADYRDSAAAVQLKEKEKGTEKLYGKLITDYSQLFFTVWLVPKKKISSILKTQTRVRYSVFD